jgi:hypothetical protein
MKYKTLIWSGCSHSYGSGIFNEVGHGHGQDLNKKKVEWTSPKCYDDFPNVVSVADAMKAVAERAYPYQIGKNLGFENIYNLSVPGKGIETQFRKVTSFIVNNEDTIDFTKAVFCYQIPDFVRFEMLDSSAEIINFANYSWDIQQMKDTDKYYNYFMNHFDFDYYVAKFLMYLYEYKGFIESKGIVFLPFHFLNTRVENEYENLYKYIRPESEIMGKNGMNKSLEWEQCDVRFPSRKKLVEKIQHWDVSSWDYPNKVETLKSAGYSKYDSHWSPGGHDAIAKNLTPILKQTLGI